MKKPEKALKSPPFSWESHVPPEAAGVCRRLADETPFLLVVAPHRRSKYGDYCYYPATGRHRITVNGNLNPYHFLLTFLHELAHLRVELRHGRRAAPHGRAWQQTFRTLVQPLLSGGVFPENLRTALYRTLARPRAGAHADPDLVRALRTHDAAAPTGPELDTLPDGARFWLGGRMLVKVRRRRTRVLAYEPSTCRHYLVGRAVVVKTEATPPAGG